MESLEYSDSDDPDRATKKRPKRRDTKKQLLKKKKDIEGNQPPVEIIVNFIEALVQLKYLGKAIEFL